MEMGDRDAWKYVFDLIKFFEDRNLDPSDASIICAGLIVSCASGSDNARHILNAVIEAHEEVTSLTSTINGKPN